MNWRRWTFCASSVLIAAISLRYFISDSNTVEHQAQRLGSRVFTVEAWAKASDVERGEMTASFLRQHDVKRLSNKQIEKLLGHPTAYYYQDTTPAYVVGPKTVSSEFADGYLWVFQASLYDGQIDQVFFVPEVK